MMFDIDAIIKELSVNRPIFHSEADFQHSLAWEIHKIYPEFDVRLEYPYRTDSKVYHVDIWLRGEEGNIAIELKYKTRALRANYNGELFDLQNQAAQDLGRYDYLVDVERIEQICNGSENTLGVAIFLTNDSAYWKWPNSQNTIYKDFGLSDGRIVQGTSKWEVSASKGTTRGRERAITLRGKYAINWQYYSQIGVGNYEIFRIAKLLLPNNWVINPII